MEIISRDFCLVRYTGSLDAPIITNYRARDFTSRGFVTEALTLLSESQQENLRSKPGVISVHVLSRGYSSESNSVRGPREVPRYGQRERVPDDPYDDELLGIFPDPIEEEENWRAMQHYYEIVNWENEKWERYQAEEAERRSRERTRRDDRAG